MAYGSYSALAKRLLFILFLGGESSSYHHQTHKPMHFSIHTWIEIPYESPRTSAYVDRDTQAHAIQHTWIEIRMEGGGDNNVGYSLQTYQPCKTSPKDLERKLCLLPGKPWFRSGAGPVLRAPCQVTMQVNLRWHFTIFYIHDSTNFCKVTTVWIPHGGKQTVVLVRRMHRKRYAQGNPASCRKQAHSSKCVKQKMVISVTFKLSPFFLLQ